MLYANRIHIAVHISLSRPPQINQKII